MMDVLSTIPPAKFQENANRLFELRLARMGLTQPQIEQQSLTELENSLVRIEHTISIAESIAVLRLSTTEVDVNPVISDTSSSLDIELVPLLLNRRQAILDRIKLLRNEHSVKTMTEIIDSVTDQQLQERLRTDLEAARQIDVLDIVQLRTDYAFIVMAMDPQNRHLEDLNDAIKEGASRCGVNAERIDDERCNQPITVRILNAIKKAEFVFVVLTYPRENVYYEAGYAQGIGKTPVFLAEEGTPIPFDLKDYPIIFYSNMRELKTALAERLTAIRCGAGTKRS